MWEDVSTFGMRSVHVGGCQYIWDEVSACGMTCTFGMMLVHVGGYQYIWDEVSSCGRMSVYLG